MPALFALIITYYPPSDFERRLEQFLTEFGQIIVVDNGSPPMIQKSLREQASRRPDSLHLLLNAENLGVARALNQGFQLAIQMGGEQVITFDQDSLPLPGMKKAMLHICNTIPNRDKIAIIASVVEDQSAGITAKFLRQKGRFLFERKYCTGQILENVSIVITSGSLHNLKIYEQVGPFRDEFFVDYVDTEYCLRVKRLGFDIIAACEARLEHKLGNQKKYQMGALEFRPTFHSPTRWYYISRNRIAMLWQYGPLFPHWLLYEIVVSSYGLVKMLLFEDQKWKKLLAVLFGSLDGLAGKMGPIPELRKTMLSH